MKAGETNVLKLLQGSKVFVIPSFQRRYSWRAREWELLWGDLIREYHTPHSDDAQALEGHFLGSIVLHPAAGPASTLMRHLVIDGQQRLTTIVLLLAAIRDVGTEFGDVDPSEYDYQYLTNPYNKEYPDRLVPTRLDRQALTQTIRFGNPVGGIGQGYEYFRKRVRDARLSVGLNLDKLATTLLLHMLLVEINTTPGDSVNNIFNTLNSKGLPLSPSDLVRNELLLHVGERNSEWAYEQYWIPMDHALVKQSASKLNDREFVTFLWSREVALNAATSRQDLFARFEARLRAELAGRKSTERESHALSIFEEIYRDHKLFVALRSPLEQSAEIEIGSAFRDSLDRLNRWGSDPTTPIALWLVKEVVESRIKESDATEAIEVLLSFLLRRTLAGIPTNQLNRLLAPIASELRVRKSESVAVDLRRLLSRQGYHWQSNAEVTSVADALPIYSTARRNVAFILREVEGLLPGHEIADFSSAQIDHIIPQALSLEGEDELQSSGYSATDVMPLLHTLGNLTLSDSNQRMGNVSFSEKKARFYSDSALRLNRELAKSGRHTPEEIRSRSLRMVQLLLHRYPGPVGLVTRDETAELTGASVGDRLEMALQSMEAGQWTTEFDLSVFLGISPDEVRRAVSLMGAVLARLVRGEDGAIPIWMASPLRNEIEMQDAESTELGQRLTEVEVRKLVDEAEGALGPSDEETGGGVF